ncbi:hypothetical protein [Aquabacterium sp.]|uniref:hypothetical protein n=1 Tax=Aquabacterium sp. TaxID=1872578 RepID=UPI0037839138
MATADTRLLARPLMVVAFGCLLLGLLGGLLRLGLNPLAAVTQDPGVSPLVGQAAVSHAALMICAFLGTVIGVERAVALRLRRAFAAPLAAATGGLALWLGEPRVADAAFVIAAVAFVPVNLALLARQRALHTGVLLLAALAWLAGCLLQWLRPGDGAVAAWWFAFLVLTIAAERLEMTRLMRHQPGARATLLAVLATLLAGAALGSDWPAAGSVVYGAALLALALWLLRHDIARRTIHADGLARYMAACLLAGHAWLGLGGIAWIALGLQPAAAWRDAALHAIGLGFVLGMVMAHAPVILPAVARIKLAFGPWFYAAPALLQLSLLLRLGGGALHPALRPLGAALNAGAVLLFLFTVLGSALLQARRHRPARSTVLVR